MTLRMMDRYLAQPFLLVDLLNYLSFLEEALAEECSEANDMLPPHLL